MRGKNTYFRQTFTQKFWALSGVFSLSSHGSLYFLMYEKEKFMTHYKLVLERGSVWCVWNMISQGVLMDLPVKFKCGTWLWFVLQLYIFIFSWVPPVLHSWPWKMHSIIVQQYLLKAPTLDMHEIYENHHICSHNERSPLPTEDASISI